MTDSNLKDVKEILKNSFPKVQILEFYDIDLFDKSTARWCWGKVFFQIGGWQMRNFGAVAVIANLTCGIALEITLIHLELIYNQNFMISSPNEKNLYVFTISEPINCHFIFIYICHVVNEKRCLPS